MTPPTGKPAIRAGKFFLGPKPTLQEVKLVAAIKTTGQFQPVKIGSHLQKMAGKDVAKIRVGVGVGTPSAFMEQAKRRFGKVPGISLGTGNTSRSVVLENQKRPGVLTVDWNNLPTIMGVNPAIHRMIGSIAEGINLNFSEIRIYLHQGPAAGQPKNLPPYCVRVRMDKGKKHERSYQLDTGTNILVVDLYGVTAEMLDLYADGFIGSELLEVHMELWAQTVGPRQRIPLSPILNHLHLWHDLNWVDGNTAIPLKQGIREQTLRQHPTPKINFQPQSTVPAIPGARFEVVAYRDFSNDFSDLDHRLKRVSVTMPADDPALIRNELAPGERSFFNSFAFYSVTTLIENYSHRLDELVGTYDSYDLEVRLSPDEPSMFIVESSDGGHAKVVLQLALRNEKLSRVLTMNHRVYSLIDRLFIDMSHR